MRSSRVYEPIYTVKKLYNDFIILQEPNICILFSWATFPVMAEYVFACHVWFSAGKHDQKTRSADFSRQSVIKYSKVRRMWYTQHTNQTQVYVLIKQLIF